MRFWSCKVGCGSSAREARLESRTQSNYVGEGIRWGRGGIGYLETCELHFSGRMPLPVSSLVRLRKQNGNCYSAPNHDNRGEWVGMENNRAFGRRGLCSFRAGDDNQVFKEVGVQQCGEQTYSMSGDLEGESWKGLESWRAVWRKDLHRTERRGALRELGGWAGSVVNSDSEKAAAKQPPLAEGKVWGGHRLEEQCQEDECGGRPRLWKWGD